MKLLLAFALVIATSSTAHADEWSSGDTVYATLSGSVGGAGGALGGGLVGSLLDGRCSFDPESDCIPAFTLAGLASGLIIGSASGVSWYGKRRGKRGSFGRAVLGAVLGHIASGAIVALAATTLDSGAVGIPVVFTAMIGMPALGATIAYKRSSGSPPDAERPISGALLDVSPIRIQLRPPVIGLAVTPGETALFVPVAGGRF